MSGLEDEKQFGGNHWEAQIHYLTSLRYHRVNFYVYCRFFLFLLIFYNNHRSNYYLQVAKGLMGERHVTSTWLCSCAQLCGAVLVCFNIFLYLYRSGFYGPQSFFFLAWQQSAYFTEKAQINPLYATCPAPSIKRKSVHTGVTGYMSMNKMLNLV